MCDLCGTDEEVKGGRRRMAYIAELCGSAQRFYSDLSDGTIKPHTDVCQRRQIVIKSLVREIFEDAL